jgi:hypothetical protein
MDEGLAPTGPLSAKADLLLLVIATLLELPFHYNTSSGNLQVFFSDLNYLLFPSG